MESQPRNPKFINNPENFPLCIKFGGSYSATVLGVTFRQL